ncbi:MAG: RHS repeat protein [Chloracidobacterium sp.]|nr:RHS repeat protein [Chloracidobacterium sp.]
MTQERKFKYYSLSRLTAEKQVEATATLNNGGEVVTSGGLWTKVLKYNTHGLLTDGYDARGVHTGLVYDGLNRVLSVTYSDGTPTVSYTYDQARSTF